MSRSTRSYSTLAVLGCFIALAACTAGAAAGLLYRWDVLSLGDALTLLRAAAWGGLGAALVSVLGMARSRPGAPRRGFLIAFAGLVAGAAVFWLPYSQRQTAEQVPAIHDITTDTRNPPVFQAVIPHRPQDANSLKYRGEDLARQQRQAYPDIRPADFEAPVEQVFGAARAVAREMGWDVIESVPEEGRIEAVATTFWFGFRDDVVVRVTSTPQGSRVDMRSVSRVGVSDAGKNAARIRAFMDALHDRL